MKFDLQRALTSPESKAIPSHPALRGREPVSIYSPGANRTEARLSQREAMRHASAYGGDQAIDWFMDCVKLYSDAISTAPWHLEREDGTKLVRERTDGTPPDAEVGPKALYELLDRPNPYMLYDELIDLLIIDLLTVGNGYWFKWRRTSDGKPLALYRLAPAHVKIVPGPFGPKRYEYQPPGAREPLKISPEQLIHYKLANPHSAYYGLGVIQGGGRSFDLELAVTDTMASYYENRADPSMIVQSERRVPRDVFNKLRAQLRQRVGGSKNAGELLVLEAGLKAQTLSPSARDALFAELSHMSRDRVFTKFRASPLLFGIVDSAAGGNKISDARREFDNATLRPFADKLQRRITESLATAWDVKHVIDYRYTMPVEELVKLGGDFSAVPGIKVREVRKFFAPLGIEESTGDPEIDELVLNLPGEEMDEDGQPVEGDAAFADRGAPSEAGRPPKGENTRVFPPGAKVRQVKAVKSPEDITLIDLQARLNALKAAPEAKAVVKFEPPASTSVGNRLSSEEQPQDPSQAARDRAVDEAANTISIGLADAVHNLERSLLDHVEGKAFKPNDLVDRMRRSIAWATFRKRVAEVVNEGVQRAISQAVIHNVANGITPPDELDYDAITKRVLNRERGPKGVATTLKTSILKKVKRALGADAGPGDVEAIVRTSLRDFREGKADTIGLTEAVTAYNEATLTVAEAAGISQVFVTDGDDHDEPCVEANGSVWEIAEARERRLEHPNCRRAFLPLAPQTVS